MGTTTNQSAGIALYCPVNSSWPGDVIWWPADGDIALGQHWPMLPCNGLLPGGNKPLPVHQCWLSPESNFTVSAHELNPTFRNYLLKITTTYPMGQCAKLIEQCCMPRFFNQETNHVIRATTYKGSRKPTVLSFTCSMVKYFQVVSSIFKWCQ